MNAISFVVLAAILAALVSTSQSATAVYYDVKDAPALFEKFIKDNNRHYKDAADRKVHYDVFVKTLAEINEMNAQKTSAVFGITSLADYTEEERKHLFGFRPLKQ